MALTADQLNVIYNNVLQRNVDFSGIQFFANRQDISDAQVRQQIELSNESQTLVAPIVRLYDTVLGRVPDAGGLKFFVNQFRAGSTLEQIAQQLISSGEFQGKTTATAGAVDVTDLTNTNQLVTDAFQSILGRSPSAGEFAYFQGRPAAQIVAQISVAPEAQQLQAAAVVSFLDSAAVGTPNTGGLESQNAGNGGQPNAGTTFALTTGADNVVGTAGNDTITGVATGDPATATISATDTINGGAGTQDILSITTTAATDALNGALVSNVEGIVVRSTGGTATLNASQVPGATFINSNLSTTGLTVTNAAAGTAFGVVGNGTVVNGDLTATYVAGATTALLTVANGTTAGAVSLAGAGLTSATITSVGAANTLGGLTLANTVTTATINAATNLVTGGITDTGLTTLAVAGAATKVDVGALGAAVTTVDASGLTAGGLTATLDAALTSFKGGQGGDVIGSAALAAGATVAAGAGNDTLIVTATADVDTAGEAKAFTGFEVLQNAGQTVDLDLFTGSTFTSLRAGAGTTVFNNVNATQAQNVTVLASDTLTLAVKNATVVGNLDTVKITVDDGAATKGAITLTTPTIAGVETLQVIGNEDTTITALTGATSVTSFTETGAGNATVTTGAVDFAANTKFDFSGTTGTVTFTAAAAQAGGGAGGLAITGSATNTNTLTGSVKADIVTGGAKSDSLVTTGGDDVVKLGGAGDTTSITTAGSNVTFTFAAGDSVSKAGVATGFDATVTDTITNIANGATFGAGAGTKFTLDTVESATAVSTGVAVTLGTTAVVNANDFFVAIPAAGNDAFVYQDTNGNKLIDTGDFSVKLTGLAATSFTPGEFAVTGGNLVFTSIV